MEVLDVSDPYRGLIGSEKHLANIYYNYFENSETKVLETKVNKLNPKNFWDYAFCYGFIGDHRPAKRAAIRKILYERQVKSLEESGELREMKKETLEKLKETYGYNQTEKFFS